MDNHIKILSTRPINDEIRHNAATQGIDIRVLSFIDTAPIQSIEVDEEVEQASQLQTVVVFTSMAAVEAYSDWFPNGRSIALDLPPETL